MLAAMWLVVMIASVALQFSLTARERHVLGLAARDRARDRAATTGALATMMARLENDLRTLNARGSAAALRASDPWLDADSLYSGPLQVGDVPIDVIVTDLGTQLNLNNLSETELKQLFGFVLRDYQAADGIAQSIMDWIDVDDLPRIAGAEREQYMRDDRLVLPTNGPFREVDDLIHVPGITDEILAAVKPYLTTYGTATRVNLNTAPEAVLRALPGMTDVTIANILAMRSGGRRITSIASVLSAQGQAGGGGQTSRAEQQLSQRATVDTRDVQLTIFVHDTLTAQPARLIALIQRGNNNTAQIRWQQW